MTKALGKEGSFARALAIALGKDFFLKILKISLPRAREQALGKGFKKIQKNYFFAEGRPSAKNFLKILKISLPRAREEALGKCFFKKNKKIYLPRVGHQQTN